LYFILNNNNTSSDKLKIEELTKKNQKLENLNYELTKDYLHLKYDSSTNEKTLYEEIELLKLQNEALSETVKDLNYKNSLDKQSSKNEIEKKTKDISNAMRNQIKNYEENINIIKEQYKQIQKIYTNKVNELQEKLKKLTNKYNLIEGRRNNEIVGYINEINLIRRRMKSYEEYIHKLKILTHGMTDNTKEIINEIDDNLEKYEEETKDLNVFLAFLNHRIISIISKINSETT